MNKDQSIQVLQDIVRIPSENDKEEEVAKYLQNIFKKHGIDSKLVEYKPGRSSLYAEIYNGEGKTLGVTGHLDVVAAGDEKEWTYPPFAAEIHDGKLYGRGACDMKAGLAALVMSMIDLNESKDFQGTIRFYGTVGEEVGQYGAEQFVKEGYADGLDALLVAEPLDDSVMYAFKGSYNYKITSTGTTAHSSTPESGNNAINHLVDVINAVNEKMDEIVNDYENEVLGKTSHSITLLDAGTQINSIPAHAEYAANMRTIPEYDNDQITTDIQAVVNEANKKDDFNIEFEVTQDCQPVEADEHSELIKTIQSVDDVPTISHPGTTDASQFVKVNPNLDIAVYGPGDGSYAHKIDEFVEVETYLDFIEKYKVIFNKFLSK